MIASKRAFLSAVLAAALMQGFAAQAQDTKKVTLAIATRDINVSYSFVTLGQTLGYFRDEGLDVNIIPGQNSSTSIQLLMTRRADVTVNAAQTVILQKVKASLPLVSFYAISRYSSNRILVNPDSPITSVAQLKGKKVGVIDLAGNAALYIRMRLQEVGLTMNDITLISTGYGTPAAEALKSGAIDAQVDFTANIVAKEAAGYKMRSLVTPDLDKEFYSFNLFTREDYLAANPDVAIKLGRAVAKASVFIKTNPEATVRLFWKQFPDRAPKDLNDPQALARDVQVLKAQSGDMGLERLPVTFKWGSQTTEVFSALQKDLVETGQMDKTLSPTVFFTDALNESINNFDRQAIVNQARIAR